MRVREFIEWLKQFPEQEAEVSVVMHKDSGDYYLQGGTARITDFDPTKETFEAYAGVLILGRHGD